MAGAAVAVAMARSRKDIVRHFTRAGATAPDKAVGYEPDDDGWRHARMRRRLFRRMRDYGAVKEPRPGLFYLDEARLEEFGWHMKRRVLGIVAIAGAAVAAIAALA